MKYERGTAIRETYLYGSSLTLDWPPHLREQSHFAHTAYVLHMQFDSEEINIAIQQKTLSDSPHNSSTTKRQLPQFTAYQTRGVLRKQNPSSLAGFWVGDM